MIKNRTTSASVVSMQRSLHKGQGSMRAWSMCNGAEGDHCRMQNLSCLCIWKRICQIKQRERHETVGRAWIQRLKVHLVQVESDKLVVTFYEALGIHSSPTPSYGRVTCFKIETIWFTERLKHLSSVTYLERDTIRIQLKQSSFNIFWDKSYNSN